MPLRPARRLALALAVAAAAALSAGASEAQDAAPRARDEAPRADAATAPPLAALGLVPLEREPSARAARAPRRAAVARQLPRGAVWTASAGSLPRLADRVRAPVFRGETSVHVPLGERLSLRTTLVEHYDGSAAKSNTLQTLVGFALRF